MKNTLVTANRGRPMGGIVLLLSSVLAFQAAGASPEKKPAAPAAPEANPSLAVNMDVASFPKSSFRSGKNPFFPRSTEVVTQVVTPKKIQMPEQKFVLNGITGPPLRSAMINGRTFLQGEEGEVRLDSGAKVLIKCAEIFDERAVIEVAGSRKELRLRLGI